jgi:hypothetical protein
MMKNSLLVLVVVLRIDMTVPMRTRTTARMMTTTAATVVMPMLVLVPVLVVERVYRVKTRHGESCLAKL